MAIWALLGCLSTHKSTQAVCRQFSPCMLSFAPCPQFHPGLLPYPSSSHPFPLLPTRSSCFSGPPDPGDPGCFSSPLQVHILQQSSRVPGLSVIFCSPVTSRDTWALGLCFSLSYWSLGINVHYTFFLKDYVEDMAGSITPLTLGRRWFLLALLRVPSVC